MASKKNKSDISINSNDISDIKKNRLITFDLREDQELKKKGKTLNSFMKEGKKTINFRKESNERKINQNQSKNVVTFIDNSFDPEKEFNEIVARHEAKKIENLKFKETEKEEVNVDSSNESLLEQEIVSQLYEPQQPINFHLNKKYKTETKEETLRNKDYTFEPQPGTSGMQNNTNISQSIKNDDSKSNFFKIDNTFSDFSLKNLRLNSLEVENEEEIAKRIRNEMQLQESLKKCSETKDEGIVTEDEDENNLIISWSSSDLMGIKRWSLFKTAVASNAIINNLSLNNVLDNVKKFTNME